MNLRDEFAAAALPALIALQNDLGPGVARGLAVLAYTYADAMLEMRNRYTDRRCEGCRADARGRRLAAPVRSEPAAPVEPVEPLMRCPECGGAALRVSASVLALVDGLDMSATTASDVEWGNDSYADCRDCDWEGTTAETYPPAVKP